MRFLPRVIPILFLAALAARVFADEPARPLGRYTFVLGTDGGSEAGCGSFTVNARGAVRGVVRLANGTVLSAGGALREDGVWPLSATLRDGRTLRGDVAFTTADRCAASLEWEGPVQIVPAAGAGEALHLPAKAPAAVATIALTLIGGRYFGNEAFFQWGSHGTMRAIVEAETGAGEEFGSEVRITRTGVFYQMTPGPRAFSLRLDPKTGLVSGRLRAPEGGSFAAHGALLSLDGQMRGFLANSQGGTFLVKDALTFSNGSSTTSSVVNTGAGTLTLNGSNTYTGGATITGGTLVINSGSTLVNGGTLTLSSGVTNVWSPNNPRGVTNTLSNLDFTNPVIPLAPVITPGGGVSTTGAGTLTLTGSNTYTGSTTITGGTLVINGGSTLVNGGTLTVTGTNTFTGSTTVTGGLVKTGAGTLTLNGGNTYGGSTSAVTGGTLQITPGSVVTPGGTLSLNGGVTTASANSVFTRLLPPAALFHLDGAQAFVRTPIPLVADANVSGGFRVTNEAGEPVPLGNVLDGQIIFINGTRYHATKRAAEDALVLDFAPL